MILFRFIGKILLFMIKELSRIIIFLFVIFVLIVGSIKIYTSHYQTTDISIEQNSYLELDFSKDLVEKRGDSLFSFDNTYNFYDVLKGIDYAAQDQKIRGIYINLDNMNLSVNHIEEIGEALDNFKKSGKKIIMFSRIMNNHNYRLAIYGDKIIMPPVHSAMLDMSGYYKEFSYYKGIADYVGVKFNVIHIGDYKSYGENYYKSDMSPEYREEVRRIYDNLFDQRMTMVAKKRSLSKDSISNLILSGKLVRSDPISGKKLGLIDELLYKSEMVEKYNLDTKVSMANYLTSVNTKKYKDKIAIIYGEGEIKYGGHKSGEISEKSLVRELREAQKDQNIKGIVLRINSPGGSALSSEIIHHEISKITKPIYVSMGATAASGGYYISSGAKKIFATNSTITGSIGVVSLIPNVSELLKKLKISTAVVEKGKFSGIDSMQSNLDKEEILKIKNSSIDVYNEFKDRVSKGRGITLESLEEIAGGRIWLGKEAIKINLVDEIGGLETTITRLAKDLNLENYQVVEIESPKDLLESIKSYKLTYMNLKTYIENPMEKLEENIMINEPLLLMPYDFN